MKSLAVSPGAVDVQLKIEPEGPIPTGTPLRITAETTNNVVWHVEPLGPGFGLLPPEWSDETHLFAEPNAPGEYTVTAIAADGTGKLGWAKQKVTVVKATGKANRFDVLVANVCGWLASARANVWTCLLVFVIGTGVGYIGKGGCHLPPIPWPIPTPTPIPQPPTPPVPPSPIPDAGLRVLVVYESAEQLPEPQREIITATVVRQWLNAHCVKVGSTPEYRFLDKDVDLANESDIWRKLMARPRTGVPWIVISTGKSGFEGLLPKSVEETMTLLQKYAE